MVKYIITQLRVDLKESQQLNDSIISANVWFSGISLILISFKNGLYLTEF